VTNQEQGFLFLLLGLLFVFGLGWKWYPKTAEQERMNRIFGRTFQVVVSIGFGLVMTAVGILKLLGVIAQ
jgi:hypothetical protein